MRKYSYGDDEDDAASTKPLKPDYTTGTTLQSKDSNSSQVKIEDKPVFSDISIKVASNLKVASNMLTEI